MQNEPPPNDTPGPSASLLERISTTLILVLKRWIEEPVGIFFALLIYFALRIPEQIPDMLTEVIIWDSESCTIDSIVSTCLKEPEDWAPFIGFVLSGLTLAGFVWLWMTTVNRTEVMLVGGRMDDKNFTTHVLSSQILPFRLAAAAAACMVVFACIAALFGSLLSNLFDTELGIILEFLALLTISLLFGSVLVLITRDGILESEAEQSYQNLVGLRKDGYSIHRRLRIPGLLWKSRVFSLPACTWMLGLNRSIFWIALLGAFFVGYAVTKVTGTWTSDVWPIRLSFFTLVFCVTVIAACFLNILVFARRKSTESQRSDRFRRLVPVGTGLVVALTLHLWLSADEFLRIFGSAASVALLAMACSIGPLVVLLSIFRDLAELALVGLGNLLEILKGKHGPRKFGYYLKERSEWDNSANALRRVGRGIAFILFMLLLLLAPFDILTRPDCPALAAGASNEEPFCKLYMVRPLEADQDAPDVPERPKLQKALKAWASGRGLTGENGDPSQEVPVIIVAAAGGASRAAAWTLRVLKELQTREGLMESPPREPNDVDAFSRHLFAISSVSGGSLGAVTFALHEAVRPGVPLPETGVDAIAQSDLLSASVGRYFFSDVLRRFGLMQVMALFGLEVDDRNRALERSFEAHWTDSEWGPDKGLDKGKAEGGLIKLGESIKLKGGAPWPRTHLLLNGVDVKSGRRIVTSTLDLSEPSPILPNSIDFFAEFGNDVPLAAAVMNSARFPLISPAGLYRSVVSLPGHLCGEQEDDERCTVERQIIDGGYFEVNGVETALELIDAIEALDRDKLGFRPVPVLVVITNAAEGRPKTFECGKKKGGHRFREGDAKGERDSLPMLRDLTLTCSSDALHAAEQLTVHSAESPRVPELLAPILGVAGIRAAHASEAMLDARARLCPSAASNVDPEVGADGSRKSENADSRYRNSLEEADRLFHVPLAMPMCRHQAAPMNWVLHKYVAIFFKGDALKAPLVKEQLDEIQDLLQRYYGEMRESAS